MSAPRSANPPPSPEDLQRQWSDFLRQQIQHLGAQPLPRTDGAGTAEQERKGTAASDFQFDRKPREVKAYLDRFVIQQEEAKKVLSVALCDHYHHVRLAQEGKSQPNYAKQNIILVGPTGVGKTYLIRSAADLIGVPFIKGDATKFSETGYVGGDVEDLVRELVRRADGDVAKAESGIIYIDEIDKIAAASNLAGRDVSGRGVQTNLLKLMEETEVPARSPQDIAGQVQAMMEMQQRGRKSPAVINTRHILFIVSGAFDGLEKIVRRRINAATIGFSSNPSDAPQIAAVLARAETRDFIEFGFEPEFIGRLPVRVVCHSLSVDDLFHVLKTSEGSIIRQYEEAFAAYGIEVLFQDDALRRIAELAAREETGARGLMTVCERVFRNIKFELPSTQVKRFVVTRELVDGPEAALEKLLAEHQSHERIVGHELIRDFAARFEENHRLALVFTEEALEALTRQAQAESIPVRDLCARLFKDYQFGLKLIAQNTGQTRFTIGPEVITDPDKVLSEWVVQSYRQGPEPQEAGAKSSP